MHGVLVLAIFGFCVPLGLVVASRRPLPAVLLLLAGAGWPATLLPTEGIVVGTLILVAALGCWPRSGWPGRRSRSQPASSSVAAAIGLSSSSAIAKDGVIAWERWDPYRSGGTPCGVDYVWDANYGGIDFPDKPTTVLRIRAPQRSLYWRATTLDQFTADRWIESLVPIRLDCADGPLARDPLLPAAAYERRAGRSRRSRSIGSPTTTSSPRPRRSSTRRDELGRVLLLGGVAGVRAARRGQRYTVFSYTPQPKPAELARPRAELSESLERYLDLGRTRVPAVRNPRPRA